MISTSEHKPQRQHDLDALRAFAMLLGIGLHASLSFAGLPWMVRDTKTSGFFMPFFMAIHGFRMPLFIFVSGYFTMMLFRQRGLASLLKQRALRVLLPLVLGLVTIIPLLHWVSDWAARRSAAQDAARKTETVERPDLLSRIRAADIEGLKKALDEGADPNQIDTVYGMLPLGWAALYGDLPAARLLIERGADVNKTDRDSYRPLHQAAFLGQFAVLELLIEKGADAKAYGKNQYLAQDSARADMDTTRMIAGLIAVPLPLEKELAEGRARCMELLASKSGVPATTAPLEAEGMLSHLRNRYRDFLISDQFNVQMSPAGQPFHLILTPIWDHLWFLWFLVWLVAIFSVCVGVAQVLNLPRLPRGLLMSPWRWFWIVPLTMIPQLFMGVLSPAFGPDTSVGLIPQPHVLLYYGIFFAIGAYYYDCDDRDHRLGRWWWLWLQLGLGVAFVVALITFNQPVVSGVFQVLYTWMLSFGLIGLFRKLVKNENRTIRYLSDSAYWLYLMHLPLVTLLQGWVRDWDYPAPLKFLFICVVATALLLISYQTMVRYTVIGRMLNGVRTRKPRETVEAVSGALKI